MSYTFPYDRLKLLAFAALGSLLLGLAAVVFGVALVDAGQARQAAAAAIAAAPMTPSGVDVATLAGTAGLMLAAGGLAAAVRALRRGAPVLEIDESGILDHRLGRHIPWAAVRAVSLRGRGLRAAIAITVDEPRAFDRGGWWQRLAERPFRSLSGPALLVNVGALSCRAEDVVLAIEACGGYPVTRA